MQNQDNSEQKTSSAENLDTSQMSGAEVLKAVGMSDTLENTEQPTIIVNSGNTAMPEPEADRQARLAEIQKQKMAKIREALAAKQVETVQSDAAPSEESPDKQISSVRKVKHKPPVSSSNTEETVVFSQKPAASAVALAERPAPEPVEFPQPPQKPEPEPPAPPEELSAPDETVPEQSAPDKPKKKKKKKKANGGKVGAVIGTGIAGVLIAGYFIGAVNYQGKFLPRTYINSLDVAGMTTEEAHDALIEAKELKDLVLIDHNGNQAVFSASDFNAAYVIPSGALNEAASEGNFNWISKLFKSSEYAVRYDYTYSEDDLRNLIKNYNWGSNISQNAKIIRSDNGKFTIQPETLGDNFDTTVLLNYVMEQLNAGKNTVNMEDSGCYENYRAKVKASDLEDDVKVYNRYANCKITFDFEDRKKVIDNDTIISWLLKKDDGSFVTTSGHSIPLNQDAIADFVAEMAEETDTYGKDREFYATLDGWITVPWSDWSMYGWKINRNATVTQIMELIDAGESVTVEPIYSEKGYTRMTDDIGTTYIDVDISAQHFWYYIDNEVIMDYDFVSGMETNPKRRTPRGIFKILRHAYGATLGTYANEGYEQWVDFWMPFTYDGCGFHDLSRGAYGGTIYMYNGSHGCLNMRWKEAKNLIDNIIDGIPVIVHD